MLRSHVNAARHTAVGRTASVPVVKANRREAFAAGIALFAGAWVVAAPSDAAASSKAAEKAAARAAAKSKAVIKAPTPVEKAAAPAVDPNASRSDKLSTAAKGRRKALAEKYSKIRSGEIEPTF